MFIVLLDEPGLFVFTSPVDAVREIEPPDAESEVRAAFDDAAVPYRVEWVRPNRRSKSLGLVTSVEFGEYRFVPAGQSDPAALIALLEKHSAFANPPEAEAELKALLERMRLVESGALFTRAIQLAGADSTRDSDEYWQLIRLLHGRPDRDVFDRAAACCTGSAAFERRVGADVLAQIGLADAQGVRPFTKETVPVLRGLLADNDEDVIAAAIHSLAHHRHAAVSDFRELAHHPSQLIREAVAFALTGHDDVEALSLLLELMTDVDDGVRDWATFAIGTQCDADGLHIRQALTDRLGDSDDGVRGEAMVGLARRRDASVIDSVVEALGSSNPGQLVFDAAEELLSAFPEEGRIKEALSKWQTGT